MNQLNFSEFLDVGNMQPISIAQIVLFILGVFFIFTFFCIDFYRKYDFVRETQRQTPKNFYEKIKMFYYGFEGFLKELQPRFQKILYLHGVLALGIIMVFISVILGIVFRIKMSNFFDDLRNIQEKTVGKFNVSLVNLENRTKTDIFNLKSDMDKISRRSENSFLPITRKKNDIILFGLIYINLETKTISILDDNENLLWIFKNSEMNSQLKYLKKDPSLQIDISSSYTYYVYEKENKKFLIISSGIKNCLIPIDNISGLSFDYFLDGILFSCSQEGKISKTADPYNCEKILNTILV